MKSRIVRKSSVFPASENEIFTRLKSLKTLQFIAAPYASFTPVNETSDFVWEAGQVSSFHFKLFGLLPFGTHTIRVITFDETTHTIFTHETNTHVPVWNHRIQLEPLAADATRYTDEVEISAGWKTIFIYLWAKCFYAHRQRKWLKLLADEPLK